MIARNYSISWQTLCFISDISCINRWISLPSWLTAHAVWYTIYHSQVPVETDGKSSQIQATFSETMAKVQTWKWIRKEVRHPQIQQPGVFDRKPTRGEIKSGNPTSAQPPSLLPAEHQLIYRQGDSHRDATAWQAVHVHFTHNAGTILNNKKRNWRRHLTHTEKIKRNDRDTF